MSSEAITRNDLEAILNELFNPLPQIDLYYPVGSYYETSDITFNPNVTWGGTWILETEGQVHVSAGTNYVVAGALTNTSDDGEATHTLTIAEMPSHTHIQNQHRHSMGNLWSDGSGSDSKYAMDSKRKNVERFTGYTTPTNQNTGGGQAHNNMPPYLAVYVWVRIG